MESDVVIYACFAVVVGFILGEAVEFLLFRAPKRQ